MKPPTFHYHRPATKREALELKERYGGDAAFLAGGQSLMPALNMRLAQPGALIDLNRVPGLAGVEVEGDRATIGAMTRHAEAERHDGLAAACPLIRAALRHVGHHVIRNRGTIGGSVAHADAAAELPATLTALKATITVEHAGGSREIRADDFFEFHFTTALAPTEMVTRITVPRLAPSVGHAFLEISRRHGDFAVAAVAALLDGELLRLAFAGVASRPLVVEIDELDPAPAAIAAADGAGLTDDLAGSAEYRRRLVGVLARRARTAAADCRRAREVVGNG